MSYTVQSSEKTVKSGAESETKALLYLMNLRTDSNEINYFVVDFFNDLTGMDRYADKLWDLQSKAERDLSPNKVGQALVTLYKNYISSIEFKYYILFVGGVSDSVRIDSSKIEFGIANIRESSLRKVRAGLVNEAISRCKESGVSGEVVSIWAGHSLTGTITTTVYTHYSDEFYLKEAQKVDYMKMDFNT